MKFLNVLVVLALASLSVVQGSPIFKSDIKTNRVIRSGENIEVDDIDIEPRPIPL